ncbi:MAG: hypothetical protein HQL46_01015 [Gammaproteobacteria bacterium]|nr:hypothetical protein [Gammaproteobacteria bacterium]
MFQCYIKVALDELINKSEDIEHGKMLYALVDFHLPSLGAIPEVKMKVSLIFPH